MRSIRSLDLGSLIARSFLQRTNHVKTGGIWHEPMTWGHRQFCQTHGESRSSHVEKLIDAASHSFETIFCSFLFLQTSSFANFFEMGLKRIRLQFIFAVVQYAKTGGQFRKQTKFHDEFIVILGGY